jgi:hypothetical protein
MKARIVRLIYTTENRGAGTDTDPHRDVIQLWSLNGNLIAEVDPFVRDGFGKNGDPHYCGVLFEPSRIGRRTNDVR